VPEPSATRSTASAIRSRSASRPINPRAAPGPAPTTRSLMKKVDALPAARSTRGRRDLVELAGAADEGPAMVTGPGVPR